MTNINIINASYGYKNKKKNVKNILDNLLIPNPNKIKICNKIFGDPCYGNVKSLIIRYQTNSGEIKEENIKENEYFYPYKYPDDLINLDLVKTDKVDVVKKDKVDVTETDKVDGGETELIKEYKICFVTSWFSKNKKKVDKEGIFEKNHKYDYYLFTNLPDIKTDLNKIVLNDIDIPNIKKYVTKSRYPKFMVWEYFKKNNMYYDLIVYYDYHLCPSNVDYNKYAHILNNNLFGCIFRTHPISLRKKHIIHDAYNELKYIVKCGKDHKYNCNKVKNFLLKQNLPPKQWLSENNFFMYNPNNELITDCFKDFWDLYSEESLSHRDQPLISYFIWKHKIKPVILSDGLHKKCGKRAKRI